MAKTDAPKAKAPSKSEILNNIATATELNKKQVQAVLDALEAEIRNALSGKGPGIFQIPGLVKILKKKVPARPAQKGVKNPLTGQLYDRPAKPASVKVAVRALKNLKAMA